MRLAKCLHGLGAIGVEILAVLMLGWVLSATHPAQGVTATEVHLPSPTVLSREQRQADREIFAADQLKRSADGLFEQLASHLSDVFTIPDET